MPPDTRSPPPATCAPEPGWAAKRGPSVARVDTARRLTEAIWHMLTTGKPFAPAGATSTALAA
jgi:hypothetical protein